MFTGIIEELGRVTHIRSSAQTMWITVQAEKIMGDMLIGDSISINGVCLTVTDFTQQEFSMDVMPETFRKTTLHELSSGSKVNLERAMRADARFGGHIVQGHVDGVGKVRQRQREHNAVVFTIEPQDHRLLRYMIDHGSVALDGISLTIVKVMDTSFTVSIIPHTLQETMLHDRQVGDALNIECDVLGKYVERLLTFGGRTEGFTLQNYVAQENRASAKPSRSAISKTYLAEHGFL